MAMTDELKIRLKEGDWDAVGTAKKLGSSAWPAIEEAAAAQNPDTRQVAVLCAAALSGPQAASILAAGLRDADEDVMLEAARQLSRAPFPGAEEAILEVLGSALPADILELLALAAGHYPSLANAPVLKMQAARADELGQCARMALARLGDAEARRLLLEGLVSPEPRTRYDTLGRMIYVGDRALAPAAKPLLGDRADAQIVGTERARRMRRVCDQALDTLAALLEIRPPFVTAVDKVYSDKELEEFSKLVK